MHHPLRLVWVVALLLGCQDVVTESGAGPEPTPDNKITLPMHTYDDWEVPLTHAQVGDTIVLDVSDLTFDTTKAYVWTAWTGETRGDASWNRPALGDENLDQPRLEFAATFPGYYKISWCPSDSNYACVFFGELQVSGEAPENDKPVADYGFNEWDHVEMLCTGYCRYLLETEFDYTFFSEVVDDDDEHHFSMEALYDDEDEWEFRRSNLTESELYFSPRKQGLVRVYFTVFDGHVTVKGLQSAEDSWRFVVRDVDNQLPLNAFFIQGHSDVSASLQFHYDESNATYLPVLQYFYERTVTNDDCQPYDRCEERHIDFSTYQNNGAMLAVPRFKQGETITFDASNSSDPEGEALSYYWTGYIDDEAETLGRPFFEGADQPTFELTLEHIGDYFVSLCVEEKAHKTLYGGRDFFTFPLYDVPDDLCPQIQVRVEE